SRAPTQSGAVPLAGAVAHLRQCVRFQDHPDVTAAVNDAVSHRLHPGEVALLRKASGAVQAAVSAGNRVDHQDRDLVRFVCGGTDGLRRGAGGVRSLPVTHPHRGWLLCDAHDELGVILAALSNELTVSREGAGARIEEVALRRRDLRGARRLHRRFVGHRWRHGRAGRRGLLWSAPRHQCGGKRCRGDDAGAGECGHGGLRSYAFAGSALRASSSPNWTEKSPLPAPPRQPSPSDSPGRLTHTYALRLPWSMMRGALPMAWP